MIIIMKTQLEANKGLYLHRFII